MPRHHTLEAIHRGPERRMPNETPGRLLGAEPLSRKSLEMFLPGQRENMEERYKADPRGYHARLIYQGYWRAAAQLKTDHEAGRL